MEFYARANVKLTVQSSKGEEERDKGCRSLNQSTFIKTVDAKYGTGRCMLNKQEEEARKSLKQPFHYRRLGASLTDWSLSTLK